MMYCCVRQSGTVHANVLLYAIKEQNDQSQSA